MRYGEKCGREVWREREQNPQTEEEVYQAWYVRILEEAILSLRGAC